jgi:hypothetical protein
VNALLLPKSNFKQIVGAFPFVRCSRMRILKNKTARIFTGILLRKKREQYRA